MKIVVLDGYVQNPGDLSWRALEDLGELTVYARTPCEKIVERITDAEAVITNKTPISKEVLDSCPQIKYIGVLATGYNVIDVDAAAEKGIPVCNVPAYGTDAVAQFAIGLLLEICHHIGHHNEAVHRGAWECSPDWCFWDYPLIELSGKTFGIIGFGHIGQKTGQIASALGMKVIYYNPRPKRSENTYFAESVSLDELLKSADVISLHCPLSPETQGMINKESIEKMKQGVILLNNSRGPLIVEHALAEALNSGKVAAAGLDVVSTEPIQKENPLLNAKNCIITPHISWAPKETRKRLMNIAVENLQNYLNGTPANVINGV